MTACGHSDLLWLHSHITSVSNFSQKRIRKEGKIPVRSFLIDIHKELFPEGMEGSKNSEGRQIYWDEEETDADEITFLFVDPFSVAQL